MSPFVRIFFAALFTVAPILIGYLVIVPSEYALNITWGHLKTFGLIHSAIYFTIFYILLED